MVYIERLYMRLWAFSPGREFCANLGRNQQSRLNLREHESLDNAHMGEVYYGVKTRRIDLNNINQSR